MTSSDRGLHADTLAWLLCSSVHQLNSSPAHARKRETEQSIRRWHSSRGPKPLDHLRWQRLRFEIGRKFGIDAAPNSRLLRFGRHRPIPEELVRDVEARSPKLANCRG